MSHIKGGIWFMSEINRAIVERTWGLQQFQLISSSASSVPNPKLAYGPRFRYEEFMIRRSTLGALMLSVSLAIVGFSLAFLSPVGTNHQLGYFRLKHAVGALVGQKVPLWCRTRPFRKA